MERTELEVRPVEPDIAGLTFVSLSIYDEHDKRVKLLTATLEAEQSEAFAVALLKRRALKRTIGTNYSVVAGDRA